MVETKGMLCNWEEMNSVLGTQLSSSTTHRWPFAARPTLSLLDGDGLLTTSYRYQVVSPAPSLGKASSVQRQYKTNKQTKTTKTPLHQLKHVRSKWCFCGFTSWILAGRITQSQNPLVQADAGKILSFLLTTLLLLVMCSFPLSISPLCYELQTQSTFCFWSFPYFSRAIMILSI